MSKMIRKLNHSEVEYGLLYVSELSGQFPKSSQPVTVIDSDGERFASKMHSFQPRIDGLTKLHTKHHSRIGQSVEIEVNPTDPGIVRVHFDDVPVVSAEDLLQPAPEQAESEGLFITASLESMLEDFIASNLSALEPNLRLYKDEDGISGRQYATEIGIIDLLCVDASNNFVVIELKRGRESDKVVGQISRYIGWVKAKLAKNAQQVRGVVVVHKPTDKYPKDSRLEYAILANPQTELRYYEISLNFFERGKVL
jgi:hypothetical protein